MVTEAIDPIKELERAIEVIKKRKQKITKSSDTTADKEEEKKPEEKKKDRPHKKIKYKSFLKVASIAIVAVVFYVIAMSLTFPNFYEALIVIIESFFRSDFDASPGLDHFVN